MKKYTKSVKEFLEVLPRASSLHWSREYRILDENYYSIFPDYPYLYDIYDHFVDVEEEKKIAVQKGAQTGLSETAINTSLWFIDNCGDVMYLLPTGGDASDFSAGRFDPALEESDYLNDMFTDVSNVGHKRAGVRNYYLRGTQSKSKLKSVPVDYLILDEFDEMVQDNVALALKRLDASHYKWKFYLSTPTYPDYGINTEYKKSDQRKWFVKCQCGKKQSLDFFKNILDYVTEEDKLNNYQDCKLRCRECGSEIDKREGKWQATNPGGKFPGYHINQLMSPTITVQELVDEWFDIQGNISAVEDFYNSRLGLPYVAEGDKLELSDIKDRIKDYKTGDKDKRSMGIDVGNYLHFVISEPDGDNKRTIKIGKITDFDDIQRYIKNYNVNVCVIDCRPETRKARELAEKIDKSDIDCTVLLCEYKDGYKHEYKYDLDNYWLYVDRTEFLDRSLGRFKQRTIKLPINTPDEYKSHLTNLIRVIEEKRSGGKIARYKNTGSDHYAHANNYDELAFELLDELDDNVWFI